MIYSIVYVIRGGCNSDVTIGFHGVELPAVFWLTDLWSSSILKCFFILIELMLTGLGPGMCEIPTESEQLSGTAETFPIYLHNPREMKMFQMEINFIKFIRIKQCFPT